MRQMHTQRTKAVIVRQLSQQELNNYFFPRPYPPWAWGLVVGSPILISIGLILQLWFVSGFGLLLFIPGFLFLLSIKRGNPDDILYDAWVDNQAKLIYKRGLQTLGITTSNLSDRVLCIQSYVLPGSAIASEYTSEEVWMKQGKDKRWRFSINVYTYIYPMKHTWCIFNSYVNVFNPLLHNDLNEIFAHEYIVSVTTNVLVDTILLEGLKYPYRTEQFCLKIANGETIKLSATVKVRPLDSATTTPIIALPDTGFTRTLNKLRSLLLSLPSSSEKTGRSFSLAETELLEDVSKIYDAIDNQYFSDYFQLGLTIIRRIGATGPVSVESEYFERSIVWEISLPQIGLRLRTQKALLFIRREEKEHAFYEYLTEMQRERDAEFILIVDIMDIHNSPLSTTPRMIWFRQKDLLEVIILSKKSLSSWLGRFITTQIDVKPLLPYQTHGAARELFFGRQDELDRLIGGNRHGGIIIGAHRSGKTSLLHNIGERLKHRGRIVIGPITPTGIENFQSFFERTLQPLSIDCPTNINPESWASALRKAYTEKQQKARFVFILDEIDDLLRVDFGSGSILGRQMRSLQSDGQCEFYLAGHKALHNAIVLEEGPFRNFAEEVVLTGLTQKASMRLIQGPMESLGFSIGNEQALRIFQGTAGVAVLIQEFCIRLLCRDVPSVDKSEIDDSAIDDVEKSSDYLNVVFDHYEYGQKWTSFCIMLIAAIHKEVSRQDLMQEIDKQGIRLSRSQLDESLKFLTKFGVLEEKELRAGYYSVLPKYLSLAIMTRDPDMLLNEKIEEGKKEMSYD